ncbi:glutamyl-tRNA amidotransferase [Mycoplasma nasistruthionis]|uniref:Glutamyl-tRNA amidotransferase n=1 Tax=Mycoplasma nasistruthionis TaxID=353852 RepID=A0A5B7XV88_9MOLU|nr:glutamyl-tRNA amidotransferase [Mycoplasma nasistruthionis]QCZ36662.1 glutamyl-tRNA amidotransferase [Mycoplasma nasistruthionis]
MKTIEKEKLIQIADSLMLEPTPVVLENILNSWISIQKQLQALDKLDLENVQPMERMDATPVLELLREDELDMSYAISKQQILNNAYNKDQDYVILTKVVK